MMRLYHGILKHAADSATVDSKALFLKLTQLRMGVVNSDLALLFEEQPHSCAVCFAAAHLQV